MEVTENGARNFAFQLKEVLKWSKKSGPQPKSAPTDQ
jgi:hypothetical protein